jgi:hypothetical protein
MRDFHKIARSLTADILESVYSDERNTLRSENEPDCEFSWREGPRPAQFFDIRTTYGGNDMNRLAEIADKVAANPVLLDKLASTVNWAVRNVKDMDTDTSEYQTVMKELVAVCAEFVRANKEKPKPTATKWGFDITDFGDNPLRFERVLARAGISPNATPDRGSMGEFIWKGSGVIIVTGNNPITGEYFQPNRRAPEIGFASYIGIEGNPEKVANVVKAVKKFATSIKDESPGERDFI